MLAEFVHFLNPFLFKIGNFGIRWYGVAYVAGFICAYFLYRYLSRKGFSELPESKVGDFIAGAALFGVLLGGRLGYYLFYQTSIFWTHPLDVLKIWEGGMSSHGGMIGLIAYTFYFSRKHNISWTNLGDNLGVVAPIGIFFGRIANFINGELWGRTTDVPWAVKFPSSLPVAPGQLPLILEQMENDPVFYAEIAKELPPRHPSQLYEALMEGLVLFSVLWFVRTRLKTPNGALTGLFFFVYGLARIFCEIFREPDEGDPLLGGLSRGQWLSCALLVLGAGFWIVAYLRRPKQAKES